MWGKRLSIAVLGAFLILGSFPVPASANLAAEPTGGIAAEGNQATFLKTADVLIDVKEESASGSGRYMLFNPSNTTEFLTICFDSGTVNSLVSVEKDGFPVTVEQGTITSHLWDYWGAVFEVAMYPGRHTNVTVEWDFNIIERSGTQYTHKTSYVARYLIIGTAGWNHSIDRVNVTFLLNSSHFKSYTSSSTGLEAYDIDGTTALTYQMSGFERQELELVVRGDSFTWDVRTLSCIVLVVIMAAIIGAAIYLRRRQKAA